MQERYSLAHHLFFSEGGVLSSHDMREGGEGAWCWAPYYLGEVQNGRCKKKEKSATKWNPMCQRTGQWRMRSSSGPNQYWAQGMKIHFLSPPVGPVRLLRSRAANSALRLGNTETPSLQTKPCLGLVCPTSSIHFYLYSPKSQKQLPQSTSYCKVKTLQ